MVSLIQEIPFHALFSAFWKAKQEQRSNIKPQSVRAKNREKWRKKKAVLISRYPDKKKTIEDCLEQKKTFARDGAIVNRARARASSAKKSRSRG